MAIVIQVIVAICFDSVPEVGKSVKNMKGNNSLYVFIFCLFLFLKQIHPVVHSLPVTMVQNQEKLSIYF